MNKKEIRKNFRNAVFKRDKHTCRICNTKREESLLDAHHVIDRSLMPNGGYVVSNGITVCKEGYHMKVEKFHITNGQEWEDGLHPDDLYALIESSKEQAEKDSQELR